MKQKIIKNQIRHGFCLKKTNKKNHLEKSNKQTNRQTNKQTKKCPKREIINKVIGVLFVFKKKIPISNLAALQFWSFMQIYANEVRIDSFFLIH